MTSEALSEPNMIPIKLEKRYPESKDEDITDAFMQGYLNGKADRPKGEWIRTGRMNIYGGIEAQCSNCGNKVMVQHLEDEWYCRHCGADMGVKGADDEDR